MRFEVNPSIQSIRRPNAHHDWVGVLGRDNWDDFNYKTSFFLSLFSPEGTEYEIGAVKIGHVELQPRTSIRDHPIPASFDLLGNDFFSVGQGDEYYSKLTSLDTAVREEVLLALRDAAYDLDILNQVANLEVFRTSLLRSVNIITLRTQLHRLATGGERHEAYAFAYAFPKKKPVKLEFAVRPNSKPPTNIHVLIGRNAVGKTTLLTRIEELVRNPEQHSHAGESFGFVDSQDGTDSFWNLVTVAFSAFDEFGEHSHETSPGSDLTFNYIGLKRPSEEGEALSSNNGSTEADQADIGGGEFVHKSRQELVQEFSDLLTEISGPSKSRRFQFAKALRVLSSDPLIAASPLFQAICSDPDEEALDVGAIVDEFRLMSSGHKIVLLTIAGLVSYVDEKTLVLIDEPETHLHPPLLSAFIRAVSDLLISRNGVAIIATHSPVVLQEVPRNCVWKLSRFGDAVKADRPVLETFGENVGTLTREVFGLEVTQSGFYKMLSDLVGDSRTYEQVIDLLDGQLGSEGKALLRVMESEE